MMSRKIPGLFFAGEVLEKELQQLVFEIPKDDLQQQQEKLAVSVSLTKRIFLLLPACIGALLHAPLFLPVRSFWPCNQE